MKEKIIVLDLSFCGSQIKVKFFKMKNINGYCYSSLKVISPKNVMYDDIIVDLTKIDSYSEKGNGIFIGQEQTHKDSLYVKRGEQKIWKNGHIGYFTLFNTLLSEQDEEIRNLLGVDSDWDGEWDNNDVIG